MSNLINFRKIEAIREARARISYYKNVVTNTRCPVERRNLEKAILKEINMVLNLFDKLSDSLNREVKEFTLEQLADYNGSGGKPAYVAVNGIVYDVSNEPTWGGASHFGLMAGKDLSAQFNSCHGMTAVLSRLPKVGILK